MGKERQGAVEREALRAELVRRVESFMAHAGGGEVEEVRRNVEPSDFGRTFLASGLVHTITGVRTRAGKRPILTRGSNGKPYVWPAEYVAKMLGKPTPGFQPEPIKVTR